MKKNKKIIFKSLLPIGAFCFVFFLLAGLLFFIQEPVHAAVGPTILKITGGGCCGLWPTNLIKSGNTLFFNDYDSTNGTELWKSDGTSDGTIMVKDINPGGGSSYPGNFADINGTLYFSATDGTHGNELWKSDGTAIGTVMIKDINPGSGDSNLWHPINANGTAYFAADDGTHGAEVWKSDGTAIGTVMIKDINPGSGGSSPQNLTYCNGLVFFTAQPGAMMGSTIYKTDGTDDGTVALILPGMATPDSLFCAGGTLYYTANNISGNTGVELGKTDGTDGGTVLVKDINSGGNSSYPQNFADIDGTLYFSASDGTHGAELWKSDGTADGTVMVKDINTGSGDSSPAQITNINGTVYFDADDGTHGSELWKSDGTADGTVMVKDINTGNGDSWAGGFTDIYGIIYFDATNVSGGKGGGTKYQLWQTDGTTSGTVPVIDIYSGGDEGVSSLTNINNTLYFTADEGVNGTQLWLYTPPAPPVASDVVINGTANVGQTVTGRYTYSDDDNSPEGTSIYRWLRDGTPILGATSTTYTVVSDDLGTSIAFEVTPAAQNGMMGMATQSNAQSVSVLTFITITAPTKISNASIADTTIHATNDLGIMASGVSVDIYSTVDASALVCAQTDSKTVDCTIHIDASGDLIIHTVDIIEHPATQTESGYLITPTIPTNTPSWYDNNWIYRKEIIIGHTRVHGSDQLNFPVLINITDSGLQAHARSDGHDILFTDSTGTTKIPYEREQYTSGTGALVAWVKIANLSHTTDTFIYMYYGNSATSDQQNSTGGVWDANFKGVWHSEDASSTTIADSTANANTGTKYGTSGPVGTTGKIGEAQSYNGVDNYIGVVPSGTLAGSFTVSVWVKVSDNKNSHTVIGTRNGSDNSFDFKFDTGNNIHGDIGDGNEWMTTGADVGTGVFSYLTDTWYKITYAVTHTGYTIYVNGIDVANGSYDENTPILFDSTHNLFIGQVGYGSFDNEDSNSGEWFKGAIDEVRVSNIARSADWIKTEYNNENNPSTFYSLGSQKSFFYTLTYTAGANGSITGTLPQTVNDGANGTAVTAVANTGYHFVNWSDTSTANPRTDTNVTADIFVTANFAVDNTGGGGGGVIFYAITASAGTNGSISPNGSTSVTYGGSQIYTITPITGYQVADVLVDGVSKGAITTFAFSNVTTNHTISATFSSITPTCKFADINCDGKVDVPDFNLLMVNWGNNPTNTVSDLNSDGKVDVLDFNLLMVNWSL